MQPPGFSGGDSKPVMSRNRRPSYSRDPDPVALRVLSGPDSLGRALGHWLGEQ